MGWWKSGKINPNKSQVDEHQQVVDESLSVWKFWNFSSVLELIKQLTSSFLLKFKIMSKCFNIIIFTLLAMAALGSLYYIMTMDVQSDENTVIHGDNDVSVIEELESAVEPEKVLVEERKVHGVITIDFNTLSDENNSKLKQLENLNYRRLRMSWVRKNGRTCLKKYVKDTNHAFSEMETIYCW